MMEYKGYKGRITALDEDQGLLHGEVADIVDVITFQGQDAKELAQAFRDSVDDYLEFCAQRGEAPDSPCSGKFLVRISPDLHRRAVVAARQRGISLNGWVTEAIAARLEPGAASRPARSRTGR